MKSDCKIGIRKEGGFSLVELLVVMALFIVVLAVTSRTFTLILRQSTQQAKQTETQMGRIVGLEMLRTDIGSAGYGLPWSFRNLISYNEAAAANVCGGNGFNGVNPASYNDSPSSAPRAILSANNQCINGSDYLIIKSTAVVTNSSAQNWSYVSYGTGTAPYPPKIWGVCNDSIDIPLNDNVIVIEPQQSSTNIRQLVMNGSGSCSTPNVCSTTFSSCTAFSPNFAPVNPGESYLIYDIGPSDTWGMPFNRADYYIATNTPTNPNLVPSYCAPNTGELVKATVSHADGTMANLLPLLDCVADIQVVYMLDTNGGGVINAETDDISSSATYPANVISNQVVEVRLYILSHEGKMDPNFTYPTYPNSTVTVGEFGLGSSDTLSTLIGAGWQNYRWKVSTIVVKTDNLL
jgi:type II secretory pathway pseudopilin PulG